MNEPSSKKPHLNRGVVLVLVICVIVAVTGIASRAAEEKRLQQKTEIDAISTVSVWTAQKAVPTEDISLPGTIQAWHEAIIYARIPGYLKAWNVDIGAQVKGGDVLAEIDAPDLDAQFHQAQADLATAEANNRLAQITAERNIALRKTDSVSQQTTDTAVETAAADQAAVESAKANLDHLQQQEDFKKIIAPFDGTITQRDTDVGALINGGNSSSTSATQQEMFHIADTSKLRVYVQVPENDAAAITPDLTAELHFPQHPQEVFTAKLARSADALDPVTRSLQIELEVDNKDGTLLSGGYTDAHLKIPTDAATLTIPVNALLFRDGEHVAVVKDNHVSLHPVTIGRDYGKTLEITSGIEVGDQLVLNPPDSLADGQKVRVVVKN